MDRTIGIALGLVLGILIVIAFVFFGSQETIDDPDISGGQTETELTRPAPPEPSPAEP